MSRTARRLAILWLIAGALWVWVVVDWRRAW